MSSKCFIFSGSQIMMNFVLSKLKSLFDNFNPISNWPNSLKNTCESFTIFKMPNPGAWFTY